MALGQDTCATTNGVGVIRLGTKAQILDEVYGSPFSLSLGLDLRFGQLTQGTRERITNLGEGTFDVAPLLSVVVLLPVRLRDTRTNLRAHESRGA